MIIKIKTSKCKHCGSKVDRDVNDPIQHAELEKVLPQKGTPLGKCATCYFGDERIFGRNNKHAGSLCDMELTNADEAVVVTVMDETELDNPDLISHGEGYKTRQQADEEDIATLKGFLEKLNETRALKALSKGEVLSFKPLTEKDNHGWKAPKRQELSQAEREQIKSKIRADIAYARSIEHK